MADTKETPDEIAGIECRHVVHCESNNHASRGDLHVVKEVVHFKDGTTKRRLKFIKNYKRPFWLTKQGYRKHEDRKESEQIDRLQKFECTQTDLVRAIAMALDNGSTPSTLRRICKSPFVYGADITSSALIKQHYLEKSGQFNTPYTVAYVDTETDVLNGTEKIICATISMKERVRTYITADMVKGYADVISTLHSLKTKLVGQVVAKRNLNWEFFILPDEASCVCEIFKTAHEWSPDFMAVWGMDFDIPKMVSALENAGLDPKDVMCDPSVPEEYRFFKYKRGPNQKKMASGKVSPILPWAQWHTVHVPASFYVIDGMCAYKQVRTGSAEKQSYSLDGVLKEEKVGIQKLDIEEAKHLEGLAWHIFMQSRHPLEYIIYNGIDCVAAEMLDEKTNDLSIALPMMTGCSEFENVKSQPRRLVDQLHHFMLKHNHVIGTTASDMDEEEDDDTIDGRGWIDESQ